MKRIILLSIILVLFSCGKKKEKNIEKKTRNSFSNKLENVIRKNVKINKLNNKRILENTKIFSNKINVEDQILPSKYDTLSIKQVNNVLTSSLPFMSKVLFANKVSLCCKNFRAGDYCLSNIYTMAIENKKIDLSKTILINWAGFAMSHRKLRHSIDILNKMKNKSEITSRSELDRLYYTAYTYWLAKDIKNYNNSAMELYDIILKYKDEIPESDIKNNINFCFAALVNCNKSEYALELYENLKRSDYEFASFIDDYTLSHMRNNRKIKYSWPNLTKQSN